MCGEDTESFKLLVHPTSFKQGRDTYHPLRGILEPYSYNSLSQIRLEQPGFEPIFDSSKCCETIDPRDKVYNLIELFQRQIIPVDYSLSITEV